MPIYTARMDTALAINTTIELDLRVTGQNIAANQTNFSYSLKIKKNNNYNDNFKGNAEIWLNVGGKQILDGASSSWTIHGGDHGEAASTSSTLKTGTFSVTHNSDGSKTANVSVLVDPNVSNVGGSWGTREQMRIEQSMVLTKINRNVSFTMSPSSTITLGNTLTVSVSGISSSNYHQAYLYVDGKSHLIGTRSGNGSISSTIPSKLVSSDTAKTVSGSVRVYSYTSLSNLTSLGSQTKTINVYIPANAPVPPTLTQSVVTGTGLPSGFVGATQHVSGKSVLTATVQGASAQSGSSINLYEVRIVASGTSTTIMSGTSTTSTVSLGTVPQVTPAAGQLADVITRVRDNRGIWSSEKKQSSLIRLHKYSTPSGSGTTKRSGTSAIVDISWSVTSIKENGTTEKNSAKIYIDTKPRSSTAWANKYANTSAAFSGTYKATLTGYSTTTSYDIRLRVIDSLGTTTVNLNSLGTESVPLDVTQRGIGVGKIHSGSGANLQVGSAGISSEGPLTGPGFNALNHTRYNDKSNYLGAGYISGGNEKPNWFGSGKLKPQMLHARNFSGAPGGWLDALWISSYTGDDVKGSNVLLLDKSANHIGYARQNFDSTTWGKYVKIWDSDNDGSGSGLDADLLDGLHASSFWSSSNDGPGSGLDADLLDGKHASQFAGFNYTKTGIFEIYEIGDMMIITGQKGTDTTVSDWTRDGTVTYPKAFAEYPRVSLTVTTFNTRDKATPYLYVNRKTGLDFTVWDSPLSSTRTVHFIAIGKV